MHQRLKKWMDEVHLVNKDTKHNSKHLKQELLAAFKKWQDERDMHKFRNTFCSQISTDLCAVLMVESQC